MGKTIYDIAKAADVSIATVSRVINNTGRVKGKTRERVMKIADEMGYLPQAFAQGLASKKKNTIAVIVPMISNYFFMEVLAGIQDQLTDQDYELNILNIKSDEDLFDQVEYYLRRQMAEGYIFISIHFSDEDWKKLERYDSSLTIVDDYCSGFDSVSVDNKKGAYKATRYFVKEGYTTIAMLSALETSKPIQQRLEGYKQALEEEGIKFDDELVISGDISYRDGFTEKSGYEAMKKLLSMSQIPDACYCSSDIKAIGALKAMDEKGVYIPLISNDNLAISEYVGLTTIAQPMYEMGQVASKNLIERLNNPNKEITHTIYSPELIIRNSTEPKITTHSNSL